MPLPSGNSWRANINGYEDNTFALTITNAQTGAVSCSMAGGTGTGFWNEHSQRLTLSIVAWAGLAPTSSMGIQGPILAVLEGYLFRSPLEPQLGQDVTVTLTGSFLMSAGPNINNTFWPELTAHRERFGWFAQTTEVL